jgi:hypothetical protein
MEQWRDDMLKGTAEAPTMEAGTTIAPPAVNTPLAWSAAGWSPEVVDYPDTGSYPAVVENRLGPAALKLAAAAVAVLVGALVVLLYQPDHDTMASTVTVTAAPPSKVIQPAEPTQDPDVVTPTPVPSPTVAPPPPVTAAPPLSRDDAFINDISDNDGYWWVNSNTSTCQGGHDCRTVEIQIAHIVCAKLAAGSSQDDVVTASMPNQRGVTRQQVSYFVNSAAKYYCPQYKELP